MALRTPAPVVSKSFVAVVLCACMQVACAANNVRIPGTYSSLVYNEESGDLIGYEVRVIPTNSGVKAVVQVAEGDAGRIYIVDFIEGSNGISFDIPLASGKRGKFKGKVTYDGLEGTVSYPSGTSEAVVLKRSVSYWEK